MDVTVPGNHAPDAYCSFHHFHGKSSRSCSHAGDGIRARVLYAEGGGMDLKTFNVFSRRRRGIKVFAISKVKSVGRNRKSQNSSHGQSGNGQMNLESSLQSFEESERNNQLRNLVMKGKFDEGIRFLESMRDRGHIPNVVICTSLIHSLCGRGKIRKATRILEIVEGSGAVPDIVTYNHLISIYCKAGKIDKAYRVFDRMGVAPNVFTYKRILHGLCGSGKLNLALKVLDRQLQRKCYPDVITCTILIEGTCKESGVEQAVKLLDELCSRGYNPDVVTYNVPVKWICKEGRLDDAIKILTTCQLC